MGPSVRLSDLTHMNPAERKSVLSDVVSAATDLPNGQVAWIESRIRSFEATSEMSSGELLDKLGDGTLEETAWIAEWLYWIDTRERILGSQARS